MKKILGLPAGTLWDPVISMLNKAGIQVITNGRCYTAQINGSNIFGEAKIMRPNSLPLEVSIGKVDAAFTGYDMLVESGLEDETKIIAEFNLARNSRTAARIAVFACKDTSDVLIDSRKVRVASEYPNIARRKFKKAKIKFSYGCTEAEVREFGFTYGIGVVDSGKSLKDNKLKIIEILFESPILLIAKRENEDFVKFGRMLKKTFG